jgi:RHS repeat-associated protein
VRERWPLRQCTIAMGVGLCALVLVAPGARAQSSTPSSSGSYETSVPFTVPPYYGLEPTVRLDYDSQRGAGPAGVGWALGGFSAIERESDLRGAPTYEASDVYTLDGMRLIACTPLLQSPGCQSPSAPNRQSYATFIESYRRIEFDPTRRIWQVWDRNGTLSTYEPDLYRFPRDPTDAVQRWRISRVEDTVGHLVEYSYLHPPGDRGEDLQTSYPLLVTYGRTTASAFSGTAVQFRYEARPDVITSGTGEMLAVENRRLKTIDVRTAGRRVRAYALRYRRSPESGRSLLQSVTEYGVDAVVNGAGSVVSGHALPPVALRYDAERPAAERFAGAFRRALRPPRWDGTPTRPTYSVGPVVINTDRRPTHDPLHTGDFDGDSRTDGLQIFATSDSHGGTILGFAVRFADGEQSVTSRDFPVKDFRTFSAWTADLNDDGRGDLVFVVWKGVPNSDPEAADPRIIGAISDGSGGFDLSPVQTPPWVTNDLFGDHRPECQPGDVNGDGKLDLACSFWQSSGQTHRLGVALSNGDGTFGLPNSQVVTTGRGARPMSVGDATGDGLADVYLADLDQTELEACPEVSASCVVHFDLLVAESRGNARFRLRHVPTGWRASTNDGLLIPKAYAADVNGDGRDDFVDLGGATFDDAGKITGGALRLALTGRDADYTMREQPVSKAITEGENLATLGDAGGDGRADLMLVTPIAAGAQGCSTAITYRHLLLTRAASNGQGFDLSAPLDDCSVSEELAKRWSQLSTLADIQPADTNGDGLADFLTGFYDEIDNKTHTFDLQDSVSRATGRDVHRWFPAEIDGDGRQDLLYISSQQSAVFVHSLIRRSNGTYASRVDSVGQAPNPALANWRVMDVDGDGRSDLVRVRCRRPGLRLELCSTEIDTLLSNGDGTWRQKFPFVDVWRGAQIQSPPWRAMDVNGDGREDLVQVTRLLAPSDSLQPGLYIKTYLADGDGGWSGQPLRGPFDVAGSDTAAWRPIDVDGDGRTDLVRVEGHAVSSASVRIAVTSLLARGRSEWVRRRHTRDSLTKEDGWIDLDAVADSRNWRVLDANGDGRGDLVHLGRTPDGLRIHTLFSEGTNFGAQETRDIDLAPSKRARLLDLTTWTTGDVNGDGRSDLVHASTGSDGVEVETLLSTGDGGWRRPAARPVPDPGSFGNRRSPTWVPADANGDGKSDLVRVDVGRRAGTKRSVFVSVMRSGARADLLTRVRNPLGGSVTVRYRPSSRYARSDPSHRCILPRGTVLPITAAITVRDGRSTWADRTRYGYACPRWSQQHRRFLGWSDVSARRVAATNRPVTRTLTLYDQSDECLTQVKVAGQLDADGDWVGARDIIAPDARGPAPPYHCRPLYHNRIQHGVGSAALNAYTYFAYDDYGNVRNIFEHGAAGTAGDERTTTLAYRYATGPWIVALPWQQTLSEGVQPTGKLLRSTFFCYDGDNGTDSTNCSGVPTKGQVTAEQHVDDTGLYVTTTRLYDQYGNLAVTQNPRHIGVGSFYDKTYHRYPEAVTNVLGHTTSMDWDLELGRLKRVTDANGAETAYRYDDVGRLRRMTVPGGLVVRRMYLAWGDPRRQHIREWINDGTPDGLWTLTYLDGLGRIYRVVREGARPNSSYVQRTEYADASLHPHTRSQWRPARATSEPVETFEYDLAGRLVRQTHPDKTSVRQRYSADDQTTTVTTINERQHAKTVSRDAYGRVTEVFERDPGTAQVATVKSTYDAADELLTRTDPNGNVTTNTWDILGQLRRVDDPDLGPRVYTYDLNGNLHTETDARNRTITYTYDLLDRPDTKRYPGATLPAVTWHYDESGHGASKGRLTSVNDPSGNGCPAGRSVQLSYDKAGRTTESTRCVEGRAETMITGYDALGRERQLTYPDQETVSYEYDAAGRLARVPGYVDALRYNAAGQYRAVDYANGVAARYRYDGEQRLRRAKLARGPDLLYDARYGYEPNGLIRRIRSSTDNLNLDFVHDELDRLREVTGDHQESFRYDPAGNLQTSPSAATYVYPPQGPAGCPVNGVPAPCPQPHAPTQVTGRLLKYEPNGGLGSVTDLATGASSGIDWNDDHQPFGLIDAGGVQTLYDYNGLGERVSTRRGSEFRRYYGPYVEHSSTRGLIKDYYAGSLRVARRQLGAVHFQHGDHLGSIRLTTDGSGFVVAHTDYSAFGTRHSTVADPGEVGFTGHRTDAGNDLVEMGARDYAPWLGQFISPDTIVPDPLSTQATNRYAYAGDSPVSSIDPTGRGPQDPPGVSGNLGSARQWYFSGSFVHSFPTITVVLPPEFPSQVRAPAQSPPQVAQPTQPPVDAGTTAPADAGTTGEVIVEEGTVTGIYTAHGFVPVDERGIPQWANIEQWLDVKCGSDAACKLANAVDWNGVGNLITVMSAATAAEVFLVGGAVAALELTGSATLGLGPYAGMTNGAIARNVIGPAQTQLLKEFLKTGAKGALEREATFKLPQGLSRAALEAYRELARRQIAAGLDQTGVQAIRLRLVERALNLLP